MFRGILAIAAATALFASTEVASANQGGAFMGLVGGAAVGNAMTGPRYYYPRRYSYYHHRHINHYGYARPYSP